MEAGRPTKDDIKHALEFYQHLYDDYINRQPYHANNFYVNSPANPHTSNFHANNSPANNLHTNNLPPIPRKRNGTINLTEMRRKVQELGYTIPCEECGMAGHSLECCREEHKDSCDHFELFESEVKFCKEENCGPIELFDIDEN